MVAVPPTPADMSISSLDREIANYDRLNMTAAPRYSDLLRERGERGGLKFNITLELIQKAARERRFLSYGEVALANGVEWQTAYRQIARHLGDLVSWSHKRGLPMISAIIVDKPNISSGAMEDSALRGFINAAKRLGAFEGGDERAFLKDEQKEVFRRLADWDTEAL